MDTQKTQTHYSGQKVLLKDNAFGDSLLPCDVEARGGVVTLLYVLDDDCGDTIWEARTESGLTTCPMESEIEGPAEAGT